MDNTSPVESREHSSAERHHLPNPGSLSAPQLWQMRSPTRYTKQLWRGQNRLDYWNDAPDRTYTLRRTLRALGITKDESRVSESSQWWAHGWKGMGAVVHGLGWGGHSSSWAMRTDKRE